MGSESKECPSCNAVYLTRWDRQICCSRSCARRLRAKTHGPNNWKGGTYRHTNGYIKQLAKGHPRADQDGYVMQHRLVMEARLGRYLLANEYVHHKNGVRDDNRDENLELWMTRKDPCGQRNVDLAHDLLSNMSDEERAEVLSKYG